MGRSNYIKFKPCLCGANNKTIWRSSDKKYYYACNKCGRTSFAYRTEIEAHAREGWNAYISEESIKWLKTKENNLSK